jgi:hypothetical protein
MLVANNKEMVPVAKTHALYAPDTCFRNGLRAATKFRETTPNMSFGPKGVDWACSLQKRRNGSGGEKSCFVCTRHPFSECVTCGNEIVRNHPKHEFWT